MGVDGNAIGTNFGRNEFKTPTNLITLKSSPWDHGNIEDIISRNRMSYVNTENTKNSFISLEFRDHKICPTAYTLRRSRNTLQILRNWNLEGSNDGEKWDVLSAHVNDESLDTKNVSNTWEIKKCNEFYKIFRIYQTNKNSFLLWYLMCTGFEIYGHLA